MACTHVRAWVAAESPAVIAAAGRFGWSDLASSDSRCACGATVGIAACLSCAAVTCARHTRGHAAAAGCLGISVAVPSGDLRCTACDTRVFCAGFESGRESVTPAAKKRRVVNATLVSAEADPLPPCRAAGGGSVPLGLRGLTNLGNTCFMSAVLQALGAAPPLRDFFLGEGHRPGGGACPLDRAADRGCLACSLDGHVAAAYAGAAAPHAPTDFLFTWWRHAGNTGLAGYQQHDAHEFYLSAMAGVHGGAKARNSRPSVGDLESSAHAAVSAPLLPGDDDPTDAAHRCKCVVHSTFGGAMLSAVDCLVCGYTSTSTDPFLDLSLELSGPGEAASVGATPSLGDCLRRFTRREPLADSERFACPRCAAQTPCAKQLALDSSPRVLCLHLKRFSHPVVDRAAGSGGHGGHGGHAVTTAACKVDTHVTFPRRLDVSPYLATTLRPGRPAEGAAPAAAADASAESKLPSAPTPVPPSPYELFAVVSHSGALEGGHYVAAVRSGGRWFLCDDAWVTEVSDAAVRGMQAYLLFYCRAA